MQSYSSRPKKTDIVRKRTGCQDCKNRRRKCDETRPECSACVRRGIKCSGYDRPVAFKDVTALAAEASKKFEAARWSALRLEDARRKRRRSEVPGEASSHVPRSDLPIGSSPSVPAPPPPWNLISTDGWPGSTFALPWPLTDTSSGPGPEMVTENSANTGVTTTDYMSTPVPGDTSYGTSTSADESSPEISAETDWDELLIPHDSDENSSPTDKTLLGEPTYDMQISLPLEESLVLHFDTNVIPAIPVAMAFSNLFKQSSCFRAAVLALSASHLKLAVRLPFDFQALRRVCDDNSVWVYYDMAVKDLQARLKQHSEKKSGEGLAGAALLLAYHELEAGTSFGIRNHASGLDAIASRLDFSSISEPNLFKAWRILRNDVRLMMTPTRKTFNAVDNYDASCLLDPQLAIRDIVSRVYGLYSRHAMEATFPPSSDLDKTSASEKVAKWLCDVLDRRCDHRNFQRGDFYKETLTKEMVLEQCDVISRRLDSWHKDLCHHDLPTAKIGTDGDIISGPSFEPIIVYRLADESKALDYLMYLASRMGVNSLRSMFDPSVSAATIDSWSKMMLGILCGMNLLQRRQFTVLRLDAIILFASNICESTNFTRTVLDYLMPKVLGAGLTASEMVSWVYLKSQLELWMREKLKGRTVRMTLTGTDEDADPWIVLTTHTVAIFGDYGGKGFFRDTIVIDPLSRI
ncbi:C6 zinc finger domain protein [Colletotrichum truncatum]|uniref:C6 zinc finger domain protein n=1 Tax=Colletotrichum truncatum TaxID=5467 RepID=A0ACC3YQA8_COLTU|nr:C6 zinc finger domain protein [Colletotrichum truncatum]KAF6796630.1 C6 zinc finger domain protein [Colletotrichum truncatum]